MLLCRASDLDLFEIPGFGERVRHSLRLGISARFTDRPVEGKEPEFSLTATPAGFRGFEKACKGAEIENIAGQISIKEITVI